MLCSQDAICGYKIMWLYVMFDLPVDTKAQRKRAALFRKNLLKDGFGMHQFSVYTRHCASYGSADVHIELRIDEKADFGLFVTVLDELRELHHENFSIATEKAEL